MVSAEQERIAKKVLDAAFEVHSQLGPDIELGAILPI
jgi:hypothetical protein